MGPGPRAPDPYYVHFWAPGAPRALESDPRHFWKKLEKVGSGGPEHFPGFLVLPGLAWPCRALLGLAGGWAEPAGGCWSLLEPGRTLLEAAGGWSLAISRFLMISQ